MAGRHKTPPPAVVVPHNPFRNSKFGDFPKRNKVKPGRLRSEKNTLGLRSNSSCQPEETALQLNNDLPHDGGDISLGNRISGKRDSGQRPLVPDSTSSNL